MFVRRVIVVSYPSPSRARGGVVGRSVELLAPCNSNAVLAHALLVLSVNARRGTTSCSTTAMPNVERMRRRGVLANDSMKRD